jgi:biotin synthase-like enzyme
MSFELNLETLSVSLYLIVIVTRQYEKRLGESCFGEGK